MFQEIPDEVTLAINLTNCPHRCAGCHSPHLHKDIGDNLDTKVIDSFLSRYGKQVTCLCFMGGDKTPDEVSELSRYVRNHSKLKTAWYSGNNEIPESFNLFDYVKVGSYMAERGGLKSKNTNQKLYKNINGAPKDITHLFHKR